MQKLIISLLLSFLFVNVKAQLETDNFISKRDAARECHQKNLSYLLVVSPETKGKPIKMLDGGGNLWRRRYMVSSAGKGKEASLMKINTLIIKKVK